MDDTITFPDSGGPLLAAVRELIDTIEDLDVSIDYLSAAVSGYSALEVGADQAILGRYANPIEKASAAVEKAAVIAEGIRRWSQNKGGGCELPSSDSSENLMILGGESDIYPLDQPSPHNQERPQPHTSHKEKSDGLDSILSYIMQLREFGML